MAHEIEEESDVIGFFEDDVMDDRGEKADDPLIIDPPVATHFIKPAAVTIELEDEDTEIEISSQADGTHVHCKGIKLHYAGVMNIKVTRGKHFSIKTKSDVAVQEVPMPEDQLIPAQYEYPVPPTVQPEPTTPEQLPTCKEPQAHCPDHCPYSCPYMRERYYRLAPVPPANQVEELKPSATETPESDEDEKDLPPVAYYRPNRVSGGCYYYGDIQHTARKFQNGNEHKVIQADFREPVMDDDDKCTDCEEIEPANEPDRLDNVIVGLTPSGKPTSDLDVLVKTKKRQSSASRNYPTVDTAEFRPDDVHEYESPFMPSRI